MDDLNYILESKSSLIKEINDVIIDFTKDKSPLIEEIANHLISSGGKRIRPLIMFLSAELFINGDFGKNLNNFGGNSINSYQNFHKNENFPHKSSLINLATAIELIHNATLLHDDVIDDSLTRRGKKTSNAIWGNKATILAGDYLFSAAFQLMVKSEKLRILELLARTSSIISNGEMMQLENSNDVNLTRDCYLEIIFAKTAILFSAACESCGILFEASEEKIIALREFGKNLGIIFQIMDDILDYFADAKLLGKQVGKDFFEGKVTLPVIIGISCANEAEKSRIEEIFSNNLIEKEKNESDLSWFMDFMGRRNILDKTMQIAAEYGKTARENLGIFPDSQAKFDLLKLVDYSLRRVL